MGTRLFNGLSTIISVGYDIASLAHDPLWSQFTMTFPRWFSSSTACIATRSVSQAESCLEEMIIESVEAPRLLRVVLDNALLEERTLRSVLEHASDHDEEVYVVIKRRFVFQH